MELMLKSHGCAVLWNHRDYHNNDKLERNTVHTLLLSPDNKYGMKSYNFVGFTYDTTLSVTAGNTLDDWSIKVINREISQEGVE